jgi:hypothetical protein
MPGKDRLEGAALRDGGVPHVPGVLPEGPGLFEREGIVEVGNVSEDDNRLAFLVLTQLIAHRLHFAELVRVRVGTAIGGRLALLFLNVALSRPRKSTPLAR